MTLPRSPFQNRDESDGSPVKGSSGGGVPGNVNCLKELFPRLIEESDGVIIAGLERECIGEAPR